MFRFPSNGKVHGKGNREYGAIWNIRSLFQFPSNGKVHGKCRTSTCRNRLPMRCKVSIPFKRESSWKGPVKGSVSQRSETIRLTVSIPFKRESSWKGFRASENFGMNHIASAILQFQFPSNGKVHGKRRLHLQSCIILKRSVFSFNSLQTGKFMESPIKDNVDSSSKRDYVSIPFKRESSWKGFPTRRAIGITTVNRCFNSLQTGKFMERVGIL